MIFTFVPQACHLSPQGGNLAPNWRRGAHGLSRKKVCIYIIIYIYMYIYIIIYMYTWKWINSTCTTVDTVIMNLVGIYWFTLIFEHDGLWKHQPYFVCKILAAFQKILPFYETIRHGDMNHQHGILVSKPCPTGKMMPKAIHGPVKLLWKVMNQWWISECWKEYIYIFREQLGWTLPNGDRETKRGRTKNML